jgi:DNA polymerase/3'-5' exonuclease PolX
VQATFHLCYKESVKLKQKRLFEEPEVCDSIPLDVARAISDKILSLTSEWLNPAVVVGSVRREKPYCKDIDIVGVGSLQNALKTISQNFKTEFKVKGDKVIKLYIETEHGKLQVDLYCATPSTFGIHKLVRTGSAEHNIWLAKYAISKGFRIRYSEGLLKHEKVVVRETEEGVFGALGLKCPSPKEREVVEGKPVWLK